MEKKLKIGVLGAGRGISLACGAKSNGMVISAVCDQNEMLCRKAAGELECQTFCDYTRMLDSDIDAVIVANYATEHVLAVKQALAAGKHVMSECMACFTMAEAVELVEAVEAAPGLVYFFAENYPFMVQNQEMKRVYESGELGEFRYGEGEYIHPIYPNEMAQLTSSPDHWRNWLPATYYCTHSMGPVMQITGTRPTSVNAMAIPYEEYDPIMRDSMRRNDGTAILMCKMSNGAVTKIIPWSHLRDHGQRYRICCSKGVMEWNQGDCNLRICRCHADYPEGTDKPEYCKYAPAFPQEHREALKHGHGGGDYFTNYWFKRAIVTGEKPLIDVYDALDMSVIGIQGYRSVLDNSNSYEIPDFRDKSMRDKYRNDNWNPDPAKPCENKPACSVTGNIVPSAEAEKIFREERSKFEESVKNDIK